MLASQIFPDFVNRFFGRTQRKRSKKTTTLWTNLQEPCDIPLYRVVQRVRSLRMTYGPIPYIYNWPVIYPPPYIANTEGELITAHLHLSTSMIGMPVALPGCNHGLKVQVFAQKIPEAKKNVSCHPGWVKGN